MQVTASKSIGVHFALVLICHAGALGCAPSPTPAARGDHRTAGKASTGGNAKIQCASSFDCPLNQMCSSAGQCEPWGDIAEAEASPIPESALPDTSCPEIPTEGITVEWHRYASSEEQAEYYNALKRMGRTLYGDGEGNDGEYLRSLHRLRRSLDAERVETIRAYLRSLRETRDAASGALQRYDRRVATVHRAEEQIHVDANRLAARDSAPGGMARDELKASYLEYLRGLYDVGVRVVVGDASGWTLHPHLYRGGTHEQDPYARFDPDFDDSGVARDGLYYIDAAEVEHILQRKASHYRGTSRVFQIGRLIALQAQTLRYVSASLDVIAQELIEMPGLESLLGEGDSAAFHEAYLDAIDAEEQRLRVEVAEFRSLDLEGIVWSFKNELAAFADDHPGLRARVLQERPDLVNADCEMRTSLASMFGVWAGWVLSLTARDALYYVLHPRPVVQWAWHVRFGLRLFMHVFYGFVMTSISLLLIGEELIELATPDVTEARDSFGPPAERYSDLFRDVARGRLSMGEALAWGGAEDGPCLTFGPTTRFVGCDGD